MSAPEQLDPATEEALIAHLLQFVTPERQARMAEVIAWRTSHIQVVVEDLYHPHNASAVMRSCECFGIQHLHVVENRNRWQPNRDVAMGAGNWIHVHRYRARGADNSAGCLQALRARGLRIVATTCPGALSVPLGELPLDQPVALWFGNEEAGLSQTALQAADLRVHIPMYGFTQSFNVSVSAAICLYELRRRLAEATAAWPLSPAERRAAYRLWLRSSLRNAEVLERAFLRRTPRPEARL